MKTATEVFLRQDLQAILQGIYVANEAALRAQGGNADYRAGFTAALLALAVALNCRPAYLVQGEDQR